MPKNTMGARIQELRKAFHLTQSELASQIGVSMAAIRNYENNLREPNSKAMAALESYFGVTGDYLRCHTGNLSAAMHSDREDCFRNDILGEVEEKLRQSLNNQPLPVQRATKNFLISVCNALNKQYQENTNSVDTVAGIDQLQEWLQFYDLLSSDGRSEMNHRLEEYQLVEELKRSGI